MGRHVTVVIPTPEREFYGSCSCRWRTMQHYPSQQLAEDEIIKHVALVEKTKAYIRKSPPSLRESRDYYERMASETPHTEEKAQWQALADEITHRLNEAGANDGTQEQLW